MNLFFHTHSFLSKIDLKKIPIKGISKVNYFGILVVFILTTLIVIPTQSQTVTILGWDASNTGGGFGSSPWTPATTSSNLTVVGLTRGSSISTSGSPAGSCWGGSGGWGGGQSDASSFYFTLAANSGYRVSLTSTLAGSTRKSTTGPTGCDIYYSVNGGSFTQASGSWTTSSTSNPGTAGSTNLSGITALQNVPAGQVIKFRVYATGATTGNWYLNNGTSGVQCLRLGGTILGSATTTLTGLGYTFGGSSTAQNFTVNGAGLTSSNATVTINGSTNYEVSTTSATSGFGSSATLTASGGSISGGNVWVRLKSGLSAGSYNSETITIGGGGVTGVPIICSGTVAAPAAPNIALNNTGFTQISSDALPNPGATGLILSRFKADITNTNATLNSIAFKTAGSYSTADITSIDLYYGTSSTMPGSPLASTSTIPASGGAITFTSLSKSITNNTSGYFWIVANLDASATVSNTIGVLGTAGTGLVLTFASGTPTGNISDPSLQTITSATAPSIVLNTAGFILNGAFGNQCINTSSSVSSYSVSGNNLITDLVITAPSGFEISTSNSPFVSNSQLNLSPQGGTVSSTNIYMRYIPTTVGTSGALNITHTSTGATSGDVAVSGIGIGTAPSITSGSVGSITSNSAIVSNSILANNCFTILSSGVCYATSTNPTTADSIIDNTSNGTPFNSSLYNLLPNTAYHFRSFVTYNNGGLQTIYGSDIGFNTLKLEPLDFPTLFSCGSTTSSTLPLTWTDASSPQAPDGYLIKWSSVSYASISAPSDGIAEANGANTRNVAQGTQTYTPSGLASATTYYFKIWSYTNNGSNINYKLVGEPQTNCTTQPYQQTSTATWNFTDGTANSSSSAITYLTVSAITQGNNNGSTTLVTSTSASTGYTGSSGTNNAGAAARTGALATGASGSAYMEFSLTPATGYTVALTAISFGNRSTGTGPQSYTLRSSLDSYSSDIATGSLQNNSTWALYSNTGLTTISALSSAITFRIYGYSGSGSVVSGTANWRIDDINITVNVSSPRTITTGNISQLAYCASGAISIPYSTNINFLPGNVFKAQLSNSNGSFASPTQIGLVTAVSSGTISTTIPANASYGSGYRIRVIGTAPAIVGSDNGTDITINTRPIPTFSTFPSAKSCINSDIIYTTQGGQSNYIWTVSGLLNTDYIITAGGTGSSDSTLTLQWLTPGNKTVTVNYSNAAGCTGVSNASVTTAVNIAGTWLGAVSNDWNNPLNWCGGVPTSSTDVTLVSGVAYWPVINADVDCRNLSIPAGDTLSINGSYLLRILGDIAGSGVVLSTGKLYMSGKGSAADISGISVVNIEFDNLYGFNLTGNLSILGISKLTEGSFTGSGSIKYGTSSTLYYNGSASQTSTNIEWPTTTSPKSIIVGTNGLILSSNRTVAGSLTLNGALTVDASTLTISGSVVNNGGSINAVNGMLVFANTSTINLPASTIVGSVKNLRLNGSGNVTLNEDISVTESLMFSNGKLYTGIYTVEMGSMAIISETNASNLQGNLYTLRSLTQNVEDTFGGLGLKIKESTLASNDYAVTRVTGTPITSGNPGAFNGNQGIKRFYTINPTVNNNLSAQVTFIYFDGELNGLNESNLRIFTHVDPYTNGSWTDLGGRMIVNTAINTIKNDSKHPVTHFSTWSLADNAAPLPISLLNFIATLEKESVILHWSTASEINNKGFEIERSIDGINWTSIGFVSGVANSQGKNNYEYIDAALPTNISTLYYRLKQYDWSGQEDWSDIASIYLKRQSLTTTAFPNPVTDKINLAITSESELEPTKIILMDVSGRVLFAITKELAKGSNLIEVSTEHLPSGLYIIRIESATETQVYKIEK